MKNPIFIPDSNIKVTPIGSISTRSNMRPDEEGWKVPVPKEFESDPTITITLTNDPAGIILWQVNVNGNVDSYIVQIKYPKNTGYESVGTYKNGKTFYKPLVRTKVSKIRIILKTVKPKDVNTYPADFLVKVSIIGCFLPGKDYFLYIHSFFMYVRVCVRVCVVFKILFT